MKALSYVIKGREACFTLHAICFLMAGILALLFAPALAIGQWNFPTVDNAVGVGEYTSIAIGQNNHVHISYHDGENSDLKYVTNASGTWVTKTFGTSAVDGTHTSIAADSEDSFYIGFKNSVSPMYTFSFETPVYVVSGGGINCPGNVSLAIDSGNIAHITYADIYPSPAFKHGTWVPEYCDSGGCTPAYWDIEQIDSGDGIGEYSSMAIDSTDNIHICYTANGNLKYLTYDAFGGPWLTPEILDSTGEVGDNCSIAIDSNNNIHVSYYNNEMGDLLYVECIADPIDGGCTWDTTPATVDSAGDVGQYSSIAISSDGLPCISYYDATKGDLKFAAYLIGTVGGGWVSQTVDSVEGGDVGQYSDIAVDSAGYVHISYYDATNTALKYATNAPPVSCEYGINPASQTFGKTGGTGSISVTTQAGCAWNANTPNGWIHITSGTGSGIGAVTFSVDANEGAERTGTITVGGQPLTVNQSASTCTCAINLQELYAPSTGGSGYKVEVTAPAGCAWTVANSEPSWINIASGASGTGNGTVEFSVGANTVPERTGALTIEGQMLTVKQRDNLFTAKLEVNLTQPGPWFTITFNNTMEDILTIRPSCYRTYFFMTDLVGKIVPPRDFITGVAIPDDVVTIPNGEFTLNCDLARMFDPRIFSLFTPPFTLMATFTNFINDPEIINGDCTGTKCYELWTGAIPSSSVTLELADLPATPPLPANVSFFPSIWQADWASPSGQTITAQIRGIAGTEVPTNILLNGSVGIKFGPFVDSSGVITVQFDAALAVQSLGSIPTPAEGYSIRVYPQVQGMIGDNYFTSQGGVDVYQDAGLVMNALTVNAVKHTVGTGDHPNTTKTPITNMTVKVYSKASGSCAAGYGVSWQNYPSIWGDGGKPPCLAVAQALTDNTGKAAFDLPKGDYLIIGKFVEGSDPALYVGVSVGAILPGTSVYKQLQVIQNAKNEKVPAKYRRLTGSELLIIEPEYVEWDSTQELYPFIFDSVGDWSVTTAVSPPEGFVSDYKNLSEVVKSGVEAVQFTITDIGSKWVPTGVTFTVKHKGKTTKLTDKIGLKLTPELAKKKGLSIYGQQ